MIRSVRGTLGNIPLPVHSGHRSATHAHSARQG